MSNLNPRGFTGWWIPVELIEDYELSFTQAALWAEIHALSRGEIGCIAGNDHFAEHLGMSERMIQNLLSVLKSKGLVYQVSFDGRTRRLACFYPVQSQANAAEQGGRKLQVRGEENFVAGVKKVSVLPIDVRASDQKEERQSEKEKTPIPPEGVLAIEQEVPPEPTEEDPIPEKPSPSKASPHQADPPVPPTPRQAKKNAVSREAATVVLKHLNNSAGKNFEPVDAHLSMIIARMSEDRVTMDGVFKMIDRQCAMWRADPKMSQYLRPATLFAKLNFANYYDERDQPIPSRNSGPAKGLNRDRSPNLIQERIIPKML